MSLFMNQEQISFAELDIATIEAGILTSYESVMQVTLYPGDPVRLFLGSLAYIIAVQNQVIDLAARQNLLAFAQGQHLDHIGMMVGTPRQGTSKAITTIRFTLVEALSFNLDIPEGSRVVSADGKSIFSTTSHGLVPRGTPYIDMEVMAIEAGAKNNGLVPGQICQLMQPIAYVKSASNITLSQLGADIESDERYRKRIQQAPENFTCAGPIASYRNHALAVHQDIADVSVWSPKPGVVDVRPIMRNGELPSDIILKKIHDVLNADSVRPLTDTLIVAAPELISYEIIVQWWLLKSNEALLTTVKKAVETAVASYMAWQRSLPGRDINPTRLISLMEQAGARRVVVDSPTFQVLSMSEIAREISVSVSYEGLEDV